jgi:hypothetical protein
VSRHRRRLSPRAVLARTAAAVLAAGALGSLGFLALATPGAAGRPAGRPALTPAFQATPGATPGASGLPSAAPTGRGPGPPAADLSSRPVRLTIPAIGLSSGLESLGLLPDGSLQPPDHWQEAGWYARGTVPGSVGPAVIAGHVDSVSGPAVFYRLRQLHVGDQVVVTRQNGAVLWFTVDGVQSYPKAHFPTDQVYGPTADPELRLITCTGDFDYRARSYLDNLVVSAHLAG